MTTSPATTRSIVIGTLLAALSAGCLVAFTLVAGSADYPSTGRVEATEPPAIAPPVTLGARPDRDSGRAPRVRPDDPSDPTQPIVLGVQVARPPERDDRDRKTKPSSKPSRDSKGKNKTTDPDQNGAPARVAKPAVQPTHTKADVPRGHAYGHDKKARPSGPPATSASSSAPRNGPPAHAVANGHRDTGRAPGHASGSGSGSTGPPAHAGGNGGGSTGPPAHAGANGHEKHPKGK